MLELDGSARGRRSAAAFAGLLGDRFD